MCCGLCSRLYRFPQASVKCKSNKRKEKISGYQVLSFLLFLAKLCIFHYSVHYPVVFSSSSPLIIDKRVHPAIATCTLSTQMKNLRHNMLLPRRVLLLHGSLPCPSWKVWQATPTCVCKWKMGKWLWCMWAPCLALPHLWNADVS